MKLGIALGGGGAKGLAHIGVLEVLEDFGVKPHFVAGTSIGSIIGGIYALDGTAKYLKEKAVSLIESQEFRNFGLDEFYKDAENILERFKKEVFEKFYIGRLLFKKSHIKTEAARKMFQDLFGDKTFKDCRRTFTCNALDIQSGEEIIFKNGSLAEAVWSSCAIPGIFPPFVKDERILVDGGVIDNIPVGPVMELGARIVIASYLGNLPEFKGHPDTGFQISRRAQSFVRYHLDQKILEPVDLVIAPDINDFHWADFSAVDELVKAGRAEAEKNIKKIKLITSLWYRLRKKLSTTI
ncbi:MAG: patatin-like phospholipase family protein [bacterium]